MTDDLPSVIDAESKGVGDTRNVDVGIDAAAIDEAVEGALIASA